MTKYEVFCTVVDTKSFTRAAEMLGYSQSAVSQTVQALESELGVRLIARGRGGAALTPDGESFLPYIRAVCGAGEALAEKSREMQGLVRSTIRIGTFTSVSRNLLPPLMKGFKTLYPEVQFVLQQGEYTGIAQWLREGVLDLGFVNPAAVTGLETAALYRDAMLAVLPPKHPLALQHTVRLAELSREAFILMDEGEHSVPLDAFAAAGLSPRIEYKVYDDYTNLAMVRRGLGVSLQYQLAVAGFDTGVALREVAEPLERTVALAWKSRETLPLAARRFAEYVEKNAPGMAAALMGRESKA